MNDIAIKVENLTKIYKLYDTPLDRLRESLHPFRKKYHKDFYALRDVGFEVKKGEIVGVIGKNGSGKSTLLKMITGVLTPSSGIVTVNGKISALLELGAGFNPEMTGVENVYMNGTLMGYTRQDMDAKLQDILDFADIGDFIRQPVKMYSSGMFARLAFAVAINVDPDILIVDEALAVGDLRFQIKCLEKFKSFMDVGKTIFFVTHDISSVKRYCTSTMWINQGKIESFGDTDIITDQYVDFLRFEDNSFADQNSIQKAPANNIGWIENVSIIDENEIENEKEIIDFGKKIKIKVTYWIEDERVKNIVIGVAIHRADNLYICGLNTLLDKFDLKWHKGKNVVYLCYNNFNLLGGSYFFDVAIHEQNAHVSIDYRARYRKFFVKSHYAGEGVFIMDHKWTL